MWYNPGLLRSWHYLYLIKRSSEFQQPAVVLPYPVLFLTPPLSGQTVLRASEAVCELRRLASCLSLIASDKGKASASAGRVSYLTPLPWAESAHPLPEAV